MSLIYNGISPEKIVYNSTNLTKVTYNNVVVWELENSIDPYLTCDDFSDLINKIPASNILSLVFTINKDYYTNNNGSNSNEIETKNSLINKNGSGSTYSLNNSSNARGLAYALSLIHSIDNIASSESETVTKNIFALLNSIAKITVVNGSTNKYAVFVPNGSAYLSASVKYVAGGTTKRSQSFGLNLTMVSNQGSVFSQTNQKIYFKRK